MERTHGAVANVLSHVMLVLASVAWMSLCAEITFRLYFRGTLSTEHLQAALQETWLGTFTQPSANHELRYELKPGADVRWDGARVVTSADGTRRISPVRTEPPAPALKIAILGDSTPFGWKVDYDETYGARLRDRLEERFGTTVDLRNFSVPGYNSRQERFTFEAHVLPWKPDLLIVHHDFNDADPIGEKPLNYMPADYGENPLHSIAVKWLIRARHVRDIERATWVPADDPAHPTQVFMYYRCAGPLYDAHLRELETIAREAAREHIRPIAFVFDTWIKRQTDFRQDPLYTLLHEPLVRALRGDGYSVLDSYPLYQELMARNGWTDLTPLWRAPADGHPSPAGHAVIASALFDHLVAAGLLPDERRSAMQRRGP